MWEVIGYRERVSKDKVYYDIYLQRDGKNQITGKEVKYGSYAKEACSYTPRIGDTIILEMGNYQGREYIRDIEVVA